MVHVKHRNKLWMNFIPYTLIRQRNGNFSSVRLCFGGCRGWGGIGIRVEFDFFFVRSLCSGFRFKSWNTAMDGFSIWNDWRMKNTNTANRRRASSSQNHNKNNWIISINEFRIADASPTFKIHWTQIKNENEINSFEGTSKNHTLHNRMRFQRPGNAPSIQSTRAVQMNSSEICIKFEWESAKVRQSINGLAKNQCKLIKNWEREREENRLWFVMQLVNVQRPYAHTRTYLSFCRIRYRLLLYDEWTVNYHHLRIGIAGCNGFHGDTKHNPLRPWIGLCVSSESTPE